MLGACILLTLIVFLGIFGFIMSARHNDRFMVVQSVLISLVGCDGLICFIASMLHLNTNKLAICIGSATIAIFSVGLSITRMIIRTENQKQFLRKLES
jgi:hypothetical protein